MQQPTEQREHEPDAIPVREYRMAGGLRRAPLWLAGGILAIILVTWRSLDMGEEWLLGGLAMMSAGLYVLTSCDRVRIDSDGVAVRWLRKWQHWPWELFRSCQVRRWYYHATFVLWDEELRAGKTKTPPRRISLHYLERADMEEALAIIARELVPPPPPPVPEPLTISRGYGLGMRKLVLDREGIEFVGKRMPWSDVPRVVLRRMTHEHADFREVAIELPRGRVVLRCKAENAAFYGKVQPEVIAEALRQWAGDRVLVVARRGAPQSPEECEERWREIGREKRRNVLRVAIILILPLFILAFGLVQNPETYFEEPRYFIIWWAMQSLLALSLLGTAGMYFVIVTGREITRERQQLERTRALFYEVTAEGLPTVASAKRGGGTAPPTGGME